MMNFTVEETNMIAIYHRGPRPMTLASLKENRPYMDVPEMLPIMDSCIKKLEAITDTDYTSIVFVEATDTPDEEMI